MIRVPVGTVDDAGDPVRENQAVLPGMELQLAPKRVTDGYQCTACWRRVPVGQHTHVCFYRE